MNSYEKENYDKCLKAGLLSGLSEENAVKVAAVIGNQISYNENSWPNISPFREVFKRLSVVMARRVMAGLIQKEIKAQTEYKTLFGLGEKYKEFDIYYEDNRQKWESCHIKLSYEAEYSAELTEEIINHLISKAEGKIIKFKCIGLDEKNYIRLYYDLI